MKCPYLQHPSFHVMNKLNMCKAVDWIICCLMKGVTFLVGISYQENRCIWERVNTSSLKYKHTVMVLSCTNKSVLEEEKYGPAFQKSVSGAAAQEQHLVPAGCQTFWVLCIHSSRWWGSPEAPGCLSWLLHSSKSWGERLKCCETSDIVNVCLNEWSATYRVGFFLYWQLMLPFSGKGRTNTSVL